MSDWKKARGCGDNACVEVKDCTEAGEVWIRHSGHPMRVMAFTAEEWRAFIAGAKEGEFDVE